MINIKRKLTLLLSLLLFSASALHAEKTVATDSAEKGLAIAVEADKRDTGFSDFTASMVMELRNKQGDVSTRTIRIKTLEVIGDGDKSMSIFDTPADVKGTAFLTFSHAKDTRRTVVISTCIKTCQTY